MMEVFLITLFVLIIIGAAGSFGLWGFLILAELRTMLKKRNV